MGAVYLGFDTTLHRRVALKVMLPECAANQTVGERFLREARAAAQVAGDHVVAIFDVGEERGLPFFAMEYLQGCTLDGYLTTRGPVTIAQAVRIGREAAQGLMAAHAKGVIHRDIKPSNLWLEAPRGRVKLLDFGLGRQNSDASNLTQTGIAIGTPAYMSPEQARGNRIDPRSDLFSLGCVLYRLCSGQLPFKGESAIEVLSALALNEPPPLRQVNADVPEALATLIHLLLQKDPARRSQSARETVTALQAISSTAPDSLDLPSQQEDGPRIAPATDEVWPERNAGNSLSQTTALRPPASRPWLWLALAGTVLLGVLAIVLFNLRISERQSEEPPIIGEPKTTASWVLSAGGSITVRSGAGEKELKGTDAELPAEFRLVRVNLAGFPVSERDMGHLNNLPDLEYLSLKGARISDAGLQANLKALPSLTQLELGATGVTTAGLSCVERLPKLHSLWLEGTKIGDDAIAMHVKGINGLKRLYLNNTPITDRALEQLKDIPDLWELSLANTSITDAGLIHLHSMKSLRGISLQSTRITSEGLKTLRAALPGCNIGANPSSNWPRQRP